MTLCGRLALQETPPPPHPPPPQDGLAKLFDALVGPGDTILVEAPTYSGSLAYLEVSV